MQIPDEQLDLFAQRLAAIGVGRRDFLKVVGAMAAFGGLGFATEAQAAKPTKPAPGEKLAKEQVFRYGGGGWYPERSREPRLQQGPLLLGCALALRGAHGLQRRLRRRCRGWRPRWRATRTARSGRSLSGRTAAGRTTAPVSRAGLRVVVEAAARSGQRGALRLLPVRHQERRGLQQEEGHRRKRGRGPRQGRLDARGDARRARAATSRCSPPTSPPCRPTSARWRSSATSGRRPATSSATGRSRSRRGSTTSRSCSRRTRTTSGPRTCT